MRFYTMISWHNLAARQCQCTWPRNSDGKSGLRQSKTEQVGFELLRPSIYRKYVPVVPLREQQRLAQLKAS